MSKTVSFIHQIDSWFQGKKVAIGSITVLVVSFLLGRSIIAVDTAKLCLDILGIMGFGSLSVGAFKAATKRRSA